MADQRGARADQDPLRFAGLVPEDPDPTESTATSTSPEAEDHAESDSAFGRPGRPLRAHPFLFGFTGALGVLTAWLVFQAVVNIRSVLVLIAAGLFLAIGLNPAVQALERLRLSRRMAILVVFLGVIAFFVVFGLTLVPPLTRQTAAFIHQVPDYIQQLQSNRRISELDRRYHILQRLQQYVTSGDLGRQAFGGILGLGRVVLSTAFSSVTILILTLYFLGALESMKEMSYRLVPRSRRERTRLLADEILRRIGGYVAGNLIISLIAGVVTFIFLEIIRVPYALPLALIVAITDLIPMVGATLGAVVVSLVGFLTSLTAGIECVIFFVAYQQFENYVIAPRVMKSSVDVPPAATIVAALIGAALLGMLGALLAIPTAAAVLLILREVVFPRQDRV